MKSFSFLALVGLVAGFLAMASGARGGELYHGGFLYRGAFGPQWNTVYYDPAWGMPEALVVPPTVRRQTNYAWGVGGFRLNRVGAKYGFECPGPMSAYNQRRYLPAPPQPSDTRQFGVNYVRGPWR